MNWQEVEETVIYHLHCKLLVSIVISKILTSQMENQKLQQFIELYKEASYAQYHQYMTRPTIFSYGEKLEISRLHHVR